MLKYKAAIELAITLSSQILYIFDIHQVKFANTDFAELDKMFGLPSGRVCNQCSPYIKEN